MQARSALGRIFGIFWRILAVRPPNLVAKCILPILRSDYLICEFRPVSILLVVFCGSLRVATVKAVFIIGQYLSAFIAGQQRT